MEIIEQIFGPRTPTLHELLLCELFRKIDLREMKGSCLPVLILLFLQSQIWFYELYEKAPIRYFQVDLGSTHLNLRYNRIYKLLIKNFKIEIIYSTYHMNLTPKSDKLNRPEMVNGNLLV